MSEDTPKQKTARPSTGLILFSTIALITMLALALLPVIFPSPDSVKDSVYDTARFFGRFHPLLLHLPIGMLTLVLILESMNFLPGANRKIDTTVPIFFTAASSIVAVVLGFLLYYGEGHSSETAEDHLWGGIIFADVVIAALLLKIWAKHGAAFRHLALPTIIASSIVLSWAAHKGAAMTKGADYLTQYAPEWVPNWAYKLLGDGTDRPDKGGDDGPIALPSELPVFEHVITPIFAEKCNYCHGDDSQKGKLRMDTMAGLLKGGSEGAALVPGDAKESLVLQRIHLPLDDEDEEHMPPKKKEQLEDWEIEIIEWWVKAGAPEDKSVVELGAPANIVEASNQLLSPAQLAALKEKKRLEEEARKAAMAQRRAELQSSMDEINGAYPGALTFVSQQSVDLTFTAVSMRQKFTDDDLAKLASVADALVALDLASTSVTDKSIDLIKSMSGLTNLKLSETGVTDSSLDAIAGLSELKSLNLYGTAVTDAGIVKLSKLTKLKRVYLWGSKATSAGADKLRSGLESVMVPEEKDPKKPSAEEKFIKPEVILGMSLEKKSA